MPEISPARTFAQRQSGVRNIRYNYHPRHSGAGGQPPASRLREHVTKVQPTHGVDRPRASRLTTELLDEGLIERQPDPKDSRYALIRLTAQGKALVNDMRTTRQAAVIEALSSFTPDESRVFADLLERFVAAWPRRDRHPRE